jgi:hypothetical protein
MWLKLATHSCRLLPARTGALADAGQGCRLNSRLKGLLLSDGARMSSRAISVSAWPTGTKKVTDAAFTAGAAITFGNF